MGEYNNSKFQVRLPIIFTLALAGGIFIGAKFFGGAPSGVDGDLGKGVLKFKEILSYIDRDYVDTVNSEQLVDNAITGMLEKLDPHTSYIPVSELQMANSQLEGDFEGIGVEFQIIKDTIYVVSPISGGPSETVGIRAGDKIVKIDGKLAAGVKMQTPDVFKKLRGPKGTKVKVTIVRRGDKKPIDFEITRDKIPTYSVDVAYMVDKQTGYIKVSRFAANTYTEFKQALIKLKSKGMTRLMIDLRDNPGGYLDRATKIADEVISGNKLIVYTDGKDAQYDQKMYANTTGDFEEGALIVLINEGSASASEILSGAIQDNDRGLIVGRRSFGKGLVQMPIPLSDGSELRLTISKYYTPSGRCIQKPFGKTAEEYEMDMIRRYEHGEFFHADSIHQSDSTKYKTRDGRIVYGGGGIMPDIFIPRDTSDYSRYLGDLYNKSVVREYTINYVAEHKKELEEMGFTRYRTDFKVTDQILNDIIELGRRSDVKFVEKEFKRSKVLLQNNVKALIARAVWKNEGFYSIYNDGDVMFREAMKNFSKAKEIEESKTK